MNDKVENLKEVEYYNNFNLVGQYLIDLKKLNPKDKKHKELVNAFTEIGFYVNTLIMNQRYIDKAISEYKSDKIRAVERARRAENE